MGDDRTVYFIYTVKGRFLMLKVQIGTIVTQVVSVTDLLPTAWSLQGERHSMLRSPDPSAFAKEPPQLYFQRQKFVSSSHERTHTRFTVIVASSAVKNSIQTISSYFIQLGAKLAPANKR